MVHTVKKIESSITRGDDETRILAVPADLYSSGATVFFTMKAAIDDDQIDESAVLQIDLNDDDIVEIGARVVKYALVLTPDDTNDLPLGECVADFQFVSADGLTVRSFPSPKLAVWLITVEGDVTRRTI